MHVHLLDGTYELFRAFYGPPSAKAPDGREVGATRGFLRSLASLLREPQVTHIAVAFDHVVESFRNDLFEGYKTGEGMDEELFAQFPLVERAASCLGVVVWPMIEFEADDAIATAAARFAQDPRLEKVVLCTPDKDLAQCVTASKVVQWDRMRDRWYDEAAVVEKFGISPSSIPDYLALVGDSADGIPGVARWGAKSTATVLQHYRSLEAIPDDPQDWAVKVRGAKGLGENLREARESASLYKTLATLRLDVPLAEDVDALRWAGPKQPELTAFCEELGISTPELPAP